MEPNSLGDLTLVRMLATGGQGEVWEALRGTERVAVKLLEASQRNSPAAARRLLNEAHIAMSLTHQNIVRVLDFRTEPRPFLVMEFLEGCALSQLVPSKGAEPLPLGLVAGLAQQALAGLAWAHGRQVVHRDIKSSNIFVTRDGVVKLVDFGIATADDLDRTRTRTGEVRGSLMYLPPEALHAERLTPRGDVYSMALVVHELLTGARYFDRGAEGPTVMAILGEPVAPPSQLRAGVPPGLDTTLLRALAKKPSERQESATELLGELQSSFAATEVWTAEDIAKWLAAHGSQFAAPAVATASFSGPMPRPRSAPERRDNPERVRPSSRRIVWASLGALAIAVTMLVAFLPRRVSEVAPVSSGVPPDTQRVPVDAGASPKPTLVVAEEPVETLLPVVRHDAGAQSAIAKKLPAVSEKITRPKKSRVESGFGIVTLDSEPWSKVYIDQAYVDHSPVQRRLPAGLHLIEMISPKGTKQFEIRVIANQEVRRKVTF